MKVEAVIVCKNIEIKNNLASLIEISNGFLIDQIPTIIPLSFFIMLRADHGDLNKSFHLNVQLISPNNDKAITLVDTTLNLIRDRHENRISGNMPIIEYGAYTLRISVNEEIKYNDVVFTIHDVQKPAPIAT